MKTGIHSGIFANTINETRISFVIYTDFVLDHFSPLSLLCFLVVMVLFHQDEPLLLQHTPIIYR